MSIFSEIYLLVIKFHPSHFEKKQKRWEAKNIINHYIYK